MNNSVVIDKKFYWELFKSTFLISAFTVGGGFVIIPLLKAKYVDHYKWMSDKEALDLVSVAQSAPGVVAVNAAIIIGYRLAGYTGAAVTLLATVLPPLITLTVISYFYDAFAHNYYVQILLRGMQCGATALILDVGINLLQKELKKKLLLPCLIIFGTFIANYFFQVNIMYLILIDAGSVCRTVQQHVQILVIHPEDIDSEPPGRKISGIGSKSASL